MRSCLAILVLTSGTLAPLAHAQFSGRVSGSVADPSGAPVPAAEVQLHLSGSSKAALTTKTTSDGLYHFVAVRPAIYDLWIEAPGFARVTRAKINVDQARETSIPAVQLSLSSVSQSIDVTAGSETVDTATTEISAVITMDQVRKLPVIDRDPLALIQTQAGVSNNGNSGDSVINGQRSSYANMTLDGINIQDNYLKDGGLDVSPNQPLLSQVHQVTLITSNASAAAPGGSAQVAFVTPSGTNELHGEATWYNRNNYFSANDWFNNQSGVARPFLNQNQLAGSIGGPIRKDKLFFYTTYEAVRLREQAPVNTTILTSDARQGIFTYQNAQGVQQKVNLLTLRGIQIDPTIAGLLAQVPAPAKINNFSVGDSTAGVLRNTAGYRFDQRSNDNRDNVTAKLDYNLSPRNALAATYLWNRQLTDRPDAENDFSVIPKVSNPSHSNFVSTSWRFTPTARLTNELRFGVNLTTIDFLTSQNFSTPIFTSTIFSDPINEAQPQGRVTNTYVVADNAAYQRGKHQFQFGFHMQRVRIHAYDNAGIVPAYDLAVGFNQAALTTADLKGARNSDLITANSLLATLGGYVDSSAQTFNITSRTSGFVPGAGNVRNFNIAETDFYIQDNWKVLPRLTATLGLRYQLPTYADERDALELLPVIQGNPVSTLLSNATLDFAGGAAGRPWYRRDKRDFAPNVGLAWDPFGRGKTSIRAGYSISYVNDQAVLAPETAAELNSGLVGQASYTNLGARASNLPAIVPPAYKVPLTVKDNYATNPLNTVGAIDPNLRTPYVQLWTFGLQHEIKGTILEARYVGNHAVGSYRLFDYNQIVIKENGFLDDFLRARSNGFLAQAAGKGFTPAYDATIPGSQQLPVFNQLLRGGTLGQGAVKNLILNGQVADLGYRYQINGANGAVNFFRNPYALGADYLTNYSNSSYNGLQVEVRRRLQSGFTFQANYTFSKVLSDSAGDSQNRLEHFLDVNNPRLERSRANFDLTHAIKGNAVYDLPFGKGRLGYRRLNPVIGGWSLGGILRWQSGAPFSIESRRGTFNRSSSGRSDDNTAVTALTGPQLGQIVGFRMTGNGPYIVTQSAINPGDGTGVNADGAAPFQGQVFFNPEPGKVGTLQRRMFSGPWSFDLDMSVQKNVKITERQTVELRMEGRNVLNHPTFLTGTQVINSTTFGAISSVLNPPRVMQFGLSYRF